jgi:hypothetical protein
MTRDHAGNQPKHPGPTRRESVTSQRDERNKAATRENNHIFKYSKTSY